MLNRILYVALLPMFVSGMAFSSDISMLGQSNLSVGPPSGTSTSPAGKELQHIPYPYIGDVTQDNAVVIDVRVFGAAGDNKADDGSALQASIDNAVSYSGIVLIPKGIYRYSTTLIIDNAIIIRGAGASEHGSYSPGKTVLYYTGTGPAIKIKGTGPEGKENIHISDLALIGTKAADGGIRAGSDGPVHKSSFKNLLIAGFTKSDADNVGYGFRADNLYTSIIENVYAHQNRDGFNIYGHATTLHFINTNSRANNRYGYLIQYLSGSKFFGSMAEDNHNTGLYVNTRNGGYTFHNDFFGFYSEANYLKAMEITSTGTGLTDIMNFYGGSIQDKAGAERITLGKCRWVWFYGTGLPTHTKGYIGVDSTKTQYSGMKGTYNANEADTGVNWNTNTGMPNFQHTDIRTWGPVKFPSKFHPASDASTLDDYRKGTWTPAYSDKNMGGNLATKLVENYGYYTKIGNMVTLWGGVTSFSTAGMTGRNAFYIQGLPFPAAAFSVGNVRVNNMNWDKTVPVVVVFKGNDYLNLNEMKDNAPATNSRVENMNSGSTSLYWTITYRTNE